MVNEKLLVKDKHRKKKKFSKIFLIIIGIVIILAAAYLSGFFAREPVNQISIEHPMKNIFISNKNAEGLIDKDASIKQGIENFDENYIIYLLVSLGTNHLHKSYTGQGAAELEISIDGETWSAIIDKGLRVQKIGIDDPDLRITMSKQVAVEALLSSSIQEQLKLATKNGQIRIEQVAGKVELASKGYLSMYQELTGEEISIE